MEFVVKEWLGVWDNFEGYIDSKDSYMQMVWDEVVIACESNPALKKMFPHGAKKFWEQACNTITEENLVRLGGWSIEEKDQGLQIAWLDESGKEIGCYEYELDQIVEKGLEGKQNLLFIAKNAPETCAFRYLLAMEPMPERFARENGGLLSHLHFQYASRLDMLIQEDKLCRPFWYATMCAGDSSILEKCNIVRALHRMPVWEQLP